MFKDLNLSEPSLMKRIHQVYAIIYLSPDISIRVLCETNKLMDFYWISAHVENNWLQSKI